MRGSRRVIALHNFNPGFLERQSSTLGFVIGIRPALAGQTTICGGRLWYGVVTLLADSDTVTVDCSVNCFVPQHTGTWRLRNPQPAAWFFAHTDTVWQCQPGRPLSCV